jgi:hypothetical protein
VRVVSVVVLRKRNGLKTKLAATRFRASLTEPSGPKQNFGASRFCDTRTNSSGPKTIIEWVAFGVF